MDEPRPLIALAPAPATPDGRAGAPSCPHCEDTGWLIDVPHGESARCAHCAAGRRERPRAASPAEARSLDRRLGELERTVAALGEVVLELAARSPRGDSMAALRASLARLGR